ncbi:hypothetical protein M0Q50_07975 [bacterium]|jgi:hypothetical protein|nr:hypothetical protein [bacterium]
MNNININDIDSIRFLIKSDNMKPYIEIKVNGITTEHDFSWTSVNHKKIMKDVLDIEKNIIRKNKLKSL